MRSFEVFAGMEPDQAERLLRELGEKQPAVLQQAIAVASAALKARPAYLRKQPFDKRARAVRRALARVSANAFAEEVLAVYFLECRRPLLVEWLDLLGLEHEEGVLAQGDPPEPPPAALEKAVAGFRSGEDGAERELLLRAFAAQSSIAWPALEGLLER